MLPDFRFVIGAGLATAFLGVTSVGLLATVRLTHQGKVGPLESSRTLAFDRADWNQFADPESVRRFDELARKVDAVEHAAQPASDQPTSAPPPVAAQAPIEAPAYDHQAETVAAPADVAAAAEAKAPELAPPLDLAPPPPARTPIPDQPSETAPPAPAAATAGSAPAADEPNARWSTPIAAPVATSAPATDMPGEPPPVAAAAPVVTSVPAVDHPSEAPAAAPAAHP